MLLLLWLILSCTLHHKFITLTTVSHSRYCSSDTCGSYLLVPSTHPPDFQGPKGRLGGKTLCLLNSLRTTPSYLSLLFSLTKGGYNLTSISESMAACTRSLLGDPLPLLTRLRPPLSGAQASITKTIQVHRRYWRSLRVMSEWAQGTGGNGGSGEGRDQRREKG